MVRPCSRNQVSFTFSFPVPPLHLAKTAVLTSPSIWRPINQPVYDCALAVCDAASLKDGDVIECDRIFLNTGAYHDTMGVVKYREGYEWYYMSEQTPEEAVMFTQHDSDVIKRRKSAPGVCLHTAFDVPGPMPPGAKPRESVEVRAFVFTYPECKIKPPAADRMVSSGLPITGSNVQHQPINAQLRDWILSILFPKLLSFRLSRKSPLLEELEENGYPDAGTKVLGVIDDGVDERKEHYHAHTWITGGCLGSCFDCFRKEERKKRI